MKNSMLAALMLAALAAGCAAPLPPPVTLTREQFATLYDDEDTFNFVWYMGSDVKFHHFCMEHLALDTNGQSINDVKADIRKTYQVPVEELGVKQPFPLTKDKNRWRVLRPHGVGNIPPL